MKLAFSVSTSKWFWIVLSAVAVIAVVVVLNSAAAQKIAESLTPPKLSEIDRADKRVVLAQNWKDETTERFHFISQGTSTLPIPYDWLIALEQPLSSPWGLLLPGAEGQFVDGEYLEHYGFISAEPSPSNPDGLPIGFASTPFQNLIGYPTTTTAVGFTCAACHTGRFTHDGTEYIVNGGPATIDLDRFSKGLGAALGQTLFTSKLPLPNHRFDRFARRVLKDRYSETGKARLAQDMQSVIEANADIGDIIDVTEGYGRLDALNRIGNQVFSKNTRRRENYQPINAPVNFPHIWTSSWFNWVQYDGSIMQPLVRNAGEALGVHANVNTTAPVGEGRFSSAVPVENLDWIERMLAGKDHPLKNKAFDGLLSPAWPAELGAIDQALAAEGGKLYAEHCQGCHLPPVNAEDKALFSGKYFKAIRYYDEDGTQTETAEPFIQVKIIKQLKIGTDPAQGEILLKRTVNTTSDPAQGVSGYGIDATVCGVGPVPAPPLSGAAAASTAGVVVPPEGSKGLVPVPVKDGPMLNFALALGATVQQVDDAWFDANLVPMLERPAKEGDRPNCLQAGVGYKARPLNGVWATGPFLHNGSIPTLDDLLRPSDQRPRFVRLGTLEFDPVKVGVKQPDLTGDSYPDYVDGAFILDTSRPGNRNTGHAFGGEGPGVIGNEAFTDGERAAIIEFLKTL